MKKMMAVIFMSGCICFLPASGLPCTTFVLDNGTSPMFGINLDYFDDAGLVMVNKRGVSKEAAPNLNAPDAKLANWTSRFGSITFNFTSREFPGYGMNEAGLVIGELWLPEGKFPEPDSRVVLGPLQWIQYQLDNFSTVEEVIASDKNVRIKDPQSPGMAFHYLVTDAAGNCASIEFIDGKMVCHTGATMPVKVLTNSSYDQSVEHLKLFQGFGGSQRIECSKSSIKGNPLGNTLDRFVCAADMLKNFDPQTVQGQDGMNRRTFDVLSRVAQPADSMWLTQWSIVIDIHNRRIYFRTNNNKKTRWINVNSFDFSCKTPVKILNINDARSGDVTNNFIDYTEQANRDLLNSDDPALINSVQNYIKSLVCTE